MPDRAKTTETPVNAFDMYNTEGRIDGPTFRDEQDNTSHATPSKTPAASKIAKETPSQ